MLLPEDLLLLFVDPHIGRTRTPAAEIEIALAGAMVLELVHSGRLAYDPNGRQLWVPDPTPLPHPFLHESLVRLRPPLRPQHAVERIRRFVRDNVMNGLHGVLVLPRRLFGTITILDPRPIDEVRTAVGSVLFSHRAPDQRAVALIALLHAVRALDRVFVGERLLMNAHAEHLIRDHPTVEAIHAAVRTRAAMAAAARHRS